MVIYIAGLVKNYDQALVKVIQTPETLRAKIIDFYIIEKIIITISRSALTLELTTTDL